MKAQDEEARVLVVANDDALRASMTTLLRSVGRRVEGFVLAEELLARTPPTGPCCLVVEVELPKIDGLDLQRLLEGRGSTSPIVFVARRADVATSVRAMKAGAVDFLTTPVCTIELLDAVDRAHERSVLDWVERRELSTLQEGRDSLTTRERDVMDLVVAGLSNKQIADRLGNTAVTVKVQRRQVMEKMHATSLAELVVMSDRLIGVPSPDRLIPVKSRALNARSSLRANMVRPCAPTHWPVPT